MKDMRSLRAALALALALMAQTVTVAGAAEETSPTFVLDLQQQNGLTVRGRVLKAADSTPLPNIPVSLAGSNVVTAADGAFAFANIPLVFGAGELAVTNAPGYGKHLEKLAPKPGATEIVVPDILLKPAGYKVTELRGCDGMFMGGVPYKNTFTALVDWDGNAPGSVEFSANGVVLSTVPTTGAQASFAANMAEAFKPDPPGGSNVVQAVAITQGGERSAPLGKPIAVIPMPAILGAPVQKGESTGWVIRDDGSIIEFELAFPEDPSTKVDTLAMKFLKLIGVEMKFSGGFSYAIKSGEWNASAGVSKDKKWEKQTQVSAFNWLGKNAYFPKFKVADHTLDFKISGQASGTVMNTNGAAITLDSMGIGLALKYEKFLTSFYLTDFLPAGQWFRFLDWARGFGVDVNCLQRADAFFVVDSSTSFKADLTKAPLQYGPGTLDIGVGARIQYEPDIYLAKAKVQGGGMVTPSFKYYPEFELTQVNAKIYGSVTVIVCSYRAYDLKFVILNIPAAPESSSAILPPSAIPLGNGLVALPLAETAGEGLIERPNLALGPERFLATDDSGIRTLASLASEEPLAIDALAAFRLMGATPAPTSGKPVALSPEPLSDPPTQADLPLVENVYPESEPALAAFGGELMLLYVGDNGSPDTLQCTDIRWTRWDGDQWSAPATILADTRAEFAPRVAFDGDGDAIAVWERVADEDFDGELEDMLGQMEIAWSRWDRATGNWTVPQTLTANALPDHAPLLAGPAEDGSVLAVWSRNARNLLVGTNGAPDQVLWSQWSPASQSWSAEQTLIPAVANRLSQALACSTNGYAIYGYTVDPDGVQTNDLDQEVFVCQRQAGAWGAPQAFTANAVADKHVHLAVAPGDIPVAVWRQGDDLVMRYGIGGTTQLVRENSATVAFADFAMTLGPGGHLALLWQEMNGEGSDAHYRVYDPVSGTWGEDALLCNDMPLERSFAPVWDAAGNLTVAYQKVQVEWVTRTFELEEGGMIEVENIPENGRTDLYVTKRSLVQDLAILPGDFTSDGFNFLPGEKVTLSAVVRNLGDLPVHNPVVAFYDGDPDDGGMLIGATNWVGWFAAASTNVAQAVWIVPEPAAPHALYVVANPDGLAAEANASNNVQTLLVGGTDLLSSLVSTSARPDGSLRVIAQVRNFGAPAAGASTLSIRKSDETGGELGPVLASAAVPELPPARHAQVALDLPAGTQTLDNEFYQIVANSSGAVSEVETNNNATVFAVHVMIDSDGDGMPDSWEIAHGLNPGVPAAEGLDTDKDGVPDRDEYRMGLNPRNPDSDGDGASDGDELAAGTDPLSATDVFRIVTLDGAEAVAMRVRWHAKAGKKYRVENAPDLAGPWSNAPSTEIQDGNSFREVEADGVMTYVDIETGHTRRFYRVRIVSGNEEPQYPAPPAGMVLIPGGTNSGTDPDYGAYSLTVDAFFMDTNEVSKAKWDGVYAWAITHDYGFDNVGSTRAVADAARHPVNTVNWFDCVKWCNARSEMEGREPAYYTDAACTQVYRTGQTLSPFVKEDSIGYRIPTATEWQYAARGGQASLRFPWGNTIDHEKANYRGEPSSFNYDLGYPGYDTRYGYQPSGTYPFTAPVNSFPDGVNEYGLMDMSGNVQEWVFAWLSGYEGTYRLYQGGSWMSIASSCRITSASSSSPATASYNYGFRTVVTAIPQ